MYKKITMALTIATILTISALALALPNRAFAGKDIWYNDISSPHAQPGTSTDHNLGGGNRMIHFSFPFPGFGPLQHCLSSKWIGC
jgi:hypothetical protein